MRNPDCHPNKKHAARGLCDNCYNKWLKDNNPKYYEGRMIYVRNKE